jgi:hypothetical protein
MACPCGVKRHLRDLGAVKVQVLLNMLLNE